MDFTLISWNVNGVRASKDQVIDLLKTYKPTVLSLQETKAEKAQLDSDFRMQPGYTSYWASGERKGYCGVANFVDEGLKPQNISRSIDNPEFDREGRVISMEFDEFVLFNVYFPNGGQGPKRLKYKLAFYDHFLKLCQKLMEAGKEIVVCGDVNTAHQEIDLARPKTNQKTSGFMPEERKWVDSYLEAGFVDTYRHLHPDKEGAYTWWTARVVTARGDNIGWRIDYYLISKGLIPHLKAADVHQDFLGSDHCPISIKLEF